MRVDKAGLFLKGDLCLSVGTQHGEGFRVTQLELSLPSALSEQTTVDV